MTWTFEFEHIGGIIDGSATVDSGVNVVKASNWQGKSSFIQVIQTAMGIAKPLTEGEDHGYVAYESGNVSGRVDLEREKSDVVRSGTPVLSDTYDIVRAELFASLGEDNEVRAAVRRGNDLESVLMRPLDFENINERIADLRKDRDRLSTEIDSAKQSKNKIPGAQERVTQLEADLEEFRAERESLEAEVDSDASTGTSTAQSDLAEAESEYERIEGRIERLEETVERTETEITDKESEIDQIDVPDAGDIDSQLETQREKLERLKRDRSVLESLHSATETILTENRLDLATDVSRELSGDVVTCWTCDSETTRADIEENLQQLGDRLRSVQNEVGEVQDRVDELKSERQQIDEVRQRKESLRTQVSDLRDKLSSKRESLENARERRSELRERINRLAEEVDENRETLTDIESRIKYCETELEEARERLSSLEEEAERLEMLKNQREEVRSDLRSLRNRKEEVRQQTRSEFDEAVQTIVEQFETGFQSARLTSEFELIVARDGREASLDALSEGELELLGFVAALAGFKTFDVGEISPFLLIDDVGSLSEENLQDLVAFLQSTTDYLIFTAYPEHASLDAKLIEPQEWEVTSRRDRQPTT